MPSTNSMTAFDADNFAAAQQANRIMLVAEIPSQADIEEAQRDAHNAGNDGFDEAGLETYKQTTSNILAHLKSINQAIADSYQSFEVGATITNLLNSTRSMLQSVTHYGSKVRDNNSRETRTLRQSANLYEQQLVRASNNASLSQSTRMALRASLQQLRKTNVSGPNIRAAMVNKATPRASITAPTLKVTARTVNSSQPAAPQQTAKATPATKNIASILADKPVTRTITGITPTIPATAITGKTGAATTSKTPSASVPIQAAKAGASISFLTPTTKETRSTLNGSPLTRETGKFAALKSEFPKAVDKSTATATSLAKAEAKTPTPPTAANTEKATTSIADSKSAPKGTATAAANVVAANTTTTPATQTTTAAVVASLTAADKSITTPAAQKPAMTTGQAVADVTVNLTATKATTASTAANPATVVMSDAKVMPVTAPIAAISEKAAPPVSQPVLVDVTKVAVSTAGEKKSAPVQTAERPSTPNITTIDSTKIGSAPVAAPAVANPTVVTAAATNQALPIVSTDTSSDLAVTPAKVATTPELTTVSYTDAGKPVALTTGDTAPPVVTTSAPLITANPLPAVDGTNVALPTYTPTPPVVGPHPTNETPAPFVPSTPPITPQVIDRAPDPVVLPAPSVPLQTIEQPKALETNNPPPNLRVDPEPQLPVASHDSNDSRQPNLLTNHEQQLEQRQASDTKMDFRETRQDLVRNDVGRFEEVKTTASESLPVEVRLENINSEIKAFKALHGDDYKNVEGYKDLIQKREEVLDEKKKKGNGEAVRPPCAGNCNKCLTPTC